MKPHELPPEADPPPEEKSMVFSSALRPRRSCEGGMKKKNLLVLSRTQKTMLVRAWMNGFRAGFRSTGIPKEEKPRLLPREIPKEFPGLSPRNPSDCRGIRGASSFMMGVGILVCNFTIVSFAENPCKEDIAKYCSGVQPGGGRIMDCLKDHYKDISQECYDKIKSGPANAQAQGTGQKPSGDPLVKACKEDVAKYCSSVLPGSGRIVNCLKDHYKDLSQECYECLAKAKPESGNASAQNNDEKSSEDDSSQ